MRATFTISAIGIMRQTKTNGGSTNANDTHRK
ncbi:Protein of unknown function [Bacillus thuringiensis]|uniref:Uncharacterized protein n=1 Tax=Bacillus thuringiensis TaxID=1428 RepID=A0A1C4EMT5_BACTU|nr:Protein of unknown function [Bacillus thuringiensis]